MRSINGERSRIDADMPIILRGHVKIDCGLNFPSSPRRSELRVKTTLNNRKPSHSGLGLRGGVYKDRAASCEGKSCA